jgi:lipoyl(octanoyl) transferase
MSQIEFLTSLSLISYEDAVAFMQNRANAILEGKAKELIWLLEHPAILTAGVSAKEEDLLSQDLPVFKTNRGGKFTLHSPGQRVCYVMLNLKERTENKIPDPKLFVKTLEEAIIETLSCFGIKGEIKPERIGVWVESEGKEQKIAAIGVKFYRGVSMHGFALNVNNDLSLFNAIVPCGLKEYGVCSIESLGVKTSMRQVDAILVKNLKKSFA